MRSTALSFVLAGAAAAAPATAQDLAEQVRAAPPDATVHFAFAARPDVCGDGESIWIGTHDGRGVSYLRSARTRAGRRPTDAELAEACENGPVHVLLERRDGAVTAAHVEVGGPVPADAHDLGSVQPDAAVAYLADTLVPAATARVASSALFAATLARDVEAWPAFLRLARDASLDDDVRRQATFWLGQAAAERAGDGLADIVSDDDEDIELRKTALFALAQRHDDSSTEFLIDVARSHEHRELRKAAIFWLGQTDDPRALALFEEILIRR
jgi:hypothetical protein